MDSSGARVEGQAHGRWETGRRAKEQSEGVEAEGMGGLLERDEKEKSADECVQSMHVPW